MFDHCEITVTPITTKQIPTHPAVSMVCPKKNFDNIAVATTPIPDHKTYKIPVFIYLSATAQAMKDEIYRISAIPCKSLSSMPFALAEKKVESTSAIMAISKNAIPRFIILSQKSFLDSLKASIK